VAEQRERERERGESEREGERGERAASGKELDREREAGKETSICVRRLSISSILFFMKNWWDPI
jgi:hypothetical protein